MRFRLVTGPDLHAAWVSVWVGGDEATRSSEKLPKHCLGRGALAAGQ
jgi:hypothetical protein